MKSLYALLILLAFALPAFAGDVYRSQSEEVIYRAFIQGAGATGGGLTTAFTNGKCAVVHVAPKTRNDQYTSCVAVTNQFAFGVDIFVTRMCMTVNVNLNDSEGAAWRLVDAINDVGIANTELIVDGPLVQSTNPITCIEVGTVIPATMKWGIQMRRTETCTNPLIAGNTECEHDSTWGVGILEIWGKR